MGSASRRCTRFHLFQRNSYTFSKCRRFTAPHDYARSAMPVCASLHSPRYVADQACIGDHTIFKKQRLDLEQAIAAMCLGVETADEAAAMQDRQDKVTVAPL